mgnify:CR=1 FL=1
MQGEKLIGRHEIDGHQVEVSSSPNGLVFLDLSDESGLDMQPQQARKLADDLLEAVGGADLSEVGMAMAGILGLPGDSVTLARLVYQTVADVLLGRPTSPKYHDAQCVLHGALKRSWGMP